MLEFRTISWNEYEDVRRSPDQKSLQTKMFWANGYIVVLAWNVDPGQYDVVRQVDGKSFMLYWQDGSNMQITAP